MRTSKIQNGCQGAPKWPTGSGKVSTPNLNLTSTQRLGFTRKWLYTTTSKIQNGSQGAPKWPTGSGKVVGRSKQLLLNKFFDPSTPSMRKGCDGGKTNGENNGEKRKDWWLLWPLRHCQESTARTPIISTLGYLPCNLMSHFYHPPFDWPFVPSWLENCWKERIYL